MFLQQVHSMLSVHRTLYHISYCHTHRGAIHIYPWHSGNSAASHPTKYNFPGVNQVYVNSYNLLKLVFIYHVFSERWRLLKLGIDIIIFWNKLISPLLLHFIEYKLYQNLNISYTIHVCHTHSYDMHTPKLYVNHHT